MTSQNTEVKEYKCSICKDKGWILTDNDTYKRCSCYEKEYAIKLWKNFGVDPNEVVKLNDYIPYDDLTKLAKEKAIRYIKDFDTIKTCKVNCYGVMGQPGAGKSHIVIAIGAALLSRNIKTVYMPYLEASRELKANVNDDEYYIKLSSRYRDAEVLIIDDLFKDKVRNGSLITDSYITKADMNHIYPILNYRYQNNLPIIFSTECTPEILMSLDVALAGRIMERCEPFMTVFKGSKYNYRMRKFLK